MSAPSTSGLLVELLLRVIDVKYGCFTLLYFIYSYKDYNIFGCQFRASCLEVNSKGHPEFE